MLRNSGYFFLALLVGAGFAFWPHYLSRFGEDIDAHTHFHAVVATAWCLLLIVQPFLIRTGRRALHRRLGALSYALAPLLVVASTLLAHARFHAMDAVTFAAEADSLYLPVQAVVLFGLAYALAMFYRRTQALHARFMIATGLVLIDPVLGRLIAFHGPPIANPLHYQLFTYGLTDAILLVLLWRPRMTPLQRRAFAAGAVAFPLAHLGWFTFAQGPLWLSFATWFRAL